MADWRLSVVIPTRNHVKLLERLLDSLAQQTLPASEFEVIVVDDGSTDGTREFLRAARFPYSLRVIENERLGPPRARNEGIAAARAQIIACLDDDVVLRDDCFMKALPYFADEKIGIVEATLYIEGQDRPLQIHASAQGLVTAAIFFRREAVRKVGGFDPQFYDPETGLFFRDDADIGFRILDAGYKAIQPPDVVAWHPVQFPSV
ncbi:MAG TPA: glycosyltransferase, partial [Bacteroidota bacterium]|nr:glycosyltransferase [Bacteroidota bacterium]